MQIASYTLELATDGFCHVLDVTDAVRGKLEQSGIESGLLTVFIVGSTAGVTTVEYEPGCVKDLEELFDNLIPPTLDYHHEQTWRDGNGFSHMRAALLKPSLTIPFERGTLALGTWQQIVVVDFDNKRRRRRVAVQVMGG